MGPKLNSTLSPMAGIGSNRNLRRHRISTAARELGAVNMCSRTAWNCVDGVQDVLWEVRENKPLEQQTTIRSTTRNPTRYNSLDNGVCGVVCFGHTQAINEKARENGPQGQSKADDDFIVRFSCRYDALYSS